MQSQEDYCSIGLSLGIIFCVLSVISWKQSWRWPDFRGRSTLFPHNISSRTTFKVLPLNLGWVPSVHSIVNTILSWFYWRPGDPLHLEIKLNGDGLSIHIFFKCIVRGRRFQPKATSHWRSSKLASLARSVHLVIFINTWKMFTTLTLTSQLHSQSRSNFETFL